MSVSMTWYDMARSPALSRSLSLSLYSYLGRIGIRREQSPVNVGTVSDVWVVAFLGGHLQGLDHDILAITGSTQEYLDYRGDNLQLYLLRANTR